VDYQLHYLDFMDIGKAKKSWQGHPKKCPLKTTQKAIRLEKCLVHQSVNTKVKALLAGYESPRRVCPLPPPLKRW
jgi:hypothetical protein